MNDCTNLRRLRLEYGITLEKLARAAGISVQHMSRMELHQVPPTWSLEKKCEAALEGIITQLQRDAQALELDYLAAKGCLLDFVEVGGHEL